MNLTFRLLFISFCFFICSSCSEDKDENPLLGNWKLITWTVGIPMELDNNLESSLNFLDKTNCNINEILSFDKNGNVASIDTFNPEITISLKDGTSDTYIVNEICAEGSIGFSTSYVQLDKQNIELNGAVGIVTSQKLTLVYTAAVKVYNEALTEVIESKDLTLVYMKN